ncbi:MAG: heat-inducible transcriptional repressor HrcA [Bacillota bacterium]|nr:heat-inducible transcriptional repressor HrcA [Bacillota bacterium]
MTLDPRKQKVLRAVTVDYIYSAEPVASQTIARKYNLGVSPATIRNDMADLETEGYLRQPHTSAGRIPSDKGYRFYVDVLMEPEEVPEATARQVRTALQSQTGGLEVAFRQALRFLSLLTEYTAIVFAPHLKGRQVKNLHLVPLDSRNVVVMLVTDPGFVQSRVVELASPLVEGAAEALSRALTQLLRGTTVGCAGRSLREDLEEVVSDPALRRQLLEMLGAGEEGAAGGGMQAEGATNLFKHPEFRDVERIREFLSLLEGKATLVELLAKIANAGGVTVRIGGENHSADLYPYSLVLAPLACQGRPVGTVGVIGPTRMVYSRSISTVQLVAECLADLLERFGR